MPQLQHTGLRINGPALKVIRSRTGWTPTTFADAVGVSREYLSNIEAGRRKSVSADKVRAFADVLDVPLAAILERPEPDDLVEGAA